MSETIPEFVKERIEKMVNVFQEELTELYRWSNIEEDEEAPTAGEIEDRIRGWLQQIGLETQELVIGQMDRNRRKGKRNCPGCGQQVYWTRYEPRNYITSLGEMQIERAYYHHAVCQCGWVPLDERLKLGASELSQRVQEMVSYLGAFMPFQKAQTYLAKYCNIHISHDSVNNTTVEIGQTLKEQQEDAVQQAWEGECLPSCEVAELPQRLYVSADGINYLLPDGNGKEIKVATIYETEERQSQEGESDIHAVDLTYVVHSEVEQLARAADLEARKRGAEAAEQIAVLGDGAKWIWKRIPILFPANKTTEILDFYHASGYIWEAASATFGQQTDEAQDWGAKHCRMLKHVGPEPILHALHELPTEHHSPSEAIAEAISYFENQGTRMNYPSYVEQGFQIGSGSAESAVNQIVAVRLNQAGMRWNPERAEAVAHVRAAILSNRWDDFWVSFSPTPRQYNR